MTAEDGHDHVEPIWQPRAHADAARVAPDAESRARDLADLESLDPGT